MKDESEKCPNCGSCEWVWLFWKKL